MIQLAMADSVDLAPTVGIYSGNKMLVSISVVGSNTHAPGRIGLGGSIGITRYVQPCSYPFSPFVPLSNLLAARSAQSCSSYRFGHQRLID